MFTVVENILGVPQLTVQITQADWKKFLGLDSSAPNLNSSILGRVGTIVRAWDAIYGESVFMLAFGVASLQVGDAVTWTAGYTSIRTVAASKGLIGISMAANTDPAALSWYCVQGQVPLRLAASTIDLPLYCSATAGSLSATVVATQGVIGAFAKSALAASIGTKLVGTTNGSALLAVADLDGLYVGAGVTGTGIPGATTIAAIGQGGTMLGAQGPQNFVVQMSANATATGQVTGTFAHGAAFALAQLQFPVAQGAV
jgi:hypothetical protein